MERKGMSARWLFSVVLLGACGAPPGDQAPPTAADDRPNILLAVADDLAYTDIGAFGGEIATPNLDALAAAGVRLTQFYSAPTCSPTRSMLMSGSDNHLAGLGNMFEHLRANQQGHPGYEGHLNTRVVALPELLRNAGYHTYMAGKWHLGLDEETSPAARGFERSFALLQGGAGHLDDLALVGPAPAIYREDGELVQLPPEFYSSRFYSERIIEYLESRPDDGRPFFAYLAFTAPHWPLQAPDESIAKYAGRYDTGYDALQASRFARLQDLGLLAEGVQMVPRLPGEPAWEDLSVRERQIESRKMEIYAAMVDDLDHHLGTVLETLERRGELDDTFIFFASDNGPEGARFEIGSDALNEWIAQCCDNSFENMGKADSYLWYGPNWARAGAAPFRMYKAFTTEGGIRVPAIVHYPKTVPAGTTYRGMATVMDVLPTILELAEIEHPQTYQGRDVLPLRGASMLPALTGARARVHDEDYVMGWEMWGRRAIRRGDWKIVWEPAGIPWEPRDPHVRVDSWRLYDLADDPSEQVDLAHEQPERLQALIAEWRAYAQETGVVLPDYGVGYAQ
jgi:arylsulfatase A-like enzyme